ALCSTRVDYASPDVCATRALVSSEAGIPYLGACVCRLRATKTRERRGARPRRSARYVRRSVGWGALLPGGGAVEHEPLLGIGELGIVLNLDRLYALPRLRVQIRRQDPGVRVLPCIGATELAHGVLRVAAGQVVYEEERRRIRIAVEPIDEGDVFVVFRVVI